MPKYNAYALVNTLPSYSCPNLHSHTHEGPPPTPRAPPVCHLCDVGREALHIQRADVLALPVAALGQQGALRVQPDHEVRTDLWQQQQGAGQGQWQVRGSGSRSGAVAAGQGQQQ